MARAVDPDDNVAVCCSWLERLTPDDNIAVICSWLERLTPNNDIAGNLVIFSTRGDVAFPEQTNGQLFSHMTAAMLLCNQPVTFVRAVKTLWREVCCSEGCGVLE